MSALSSEMRTHLHDHGYLAIQSLISPEAVIQLQAIYDRLFTEQAGRGEGNQYDLAGNDSETGAARLPQIMHPAKYAPELLDTALYRVVSDLVVDLLGAGAETRFEHAICKPPNSGAPTPWHQDAAYWDPSNRYRDISVWVPLQEATLENGCMHFVPDSHRLDVLPHQSIGGDPTVHGLELAPGQEQHTLNALACPLPPGGATIHGGYTLHYAPENRSTVPRRALILCGRPADGPTPRKRAMKFPWLEERKTARMQRTQAAESEAD